MPHMDRARSCSSAEVSEIFGHCVSSSTRLHVGELVARQKSSPGRPCTWEGGPGAASIAFASGLDGPCCQVMLLTGVLQQSLLGELGAGLSLMSATWPPTDVGRDAGRPGLGLLSSSSSPASLRCGSHFGLSTEKHT